MLTKEQSMEITVLQKHGESIRALAQKLGYSRNTIRKILRNGGPVERAKRAPLPEKLDPFKEHLESRVKAAHPDWIPATALLKEVQQMGYKGGISRLRQFLASLRPPLPPEEPDNRFETPPGQQMQCDWVVFRRGRDRLSAFVATLGHSRASYVEFVTDEKIETLLACHEKAFDFFGGVPQQGLYDNMKTVVVERDAYGAGKHRFHPQFVDFAKHWGFVPHLCRPYRARTKGKVERFNRYLRNTFYVTLKSRLAAIGLVLDRDTANVEVRRWLREDANARIHGTTKRRPVDMLMEEQPHLQPLPPEYKGVSLRQQTLFPVDPLPVESLQHALSVYDAIAAEAD